MKLVRDLGNRCANDGLDVPCVNSILSVLARLSQVLT